MRSTKVLWGLGALGGLVITGSIAGCGSGKTPVAASPKNNATANNPVAAQNNSCVRAHPGVGAKRHGKVVTSSGVALAKTENTTIAYVADADEPTLHTVDINAGKEIAVTDLKGKPEQVMVLADGRVAVTLRYNNQVQILEPTAKEAAPLESRCLVETPSEPIALADNQDGSNVVVTSAWAHKLTSFDGGNFTKKFEVDVAREPRQVVLSDDGRRAFVAHLVNAQMSVVDLDIDKHEVRHLTQSLKRVDPTIPGQPLPAATAAEKPRGGCQGYALAKSVPTDPDDPEIPQGELPSVKITPPQPIHPTPKPQPKPQPQIKPQPAPTVPGRIFGPMVTVNPGESLRIAYYGSSDGLATEVGHVSVVDANAERVMSRSILNLRKGGGRVEAGECLLPRAAAYHEASLFVTCLGVDSLVQYDARALDPSRAEVRRWQVPAGPTGLAIDNEKKRAVVWSQFDRSLAIVSLDQEDAQPKVLPLSRKAGYGLVGDAALGRVLYHKSGEGRISVEGMACASCHPDGREDALTWGTIDGPRQTPMLAGRLAETAPYSWQGNHQTLEIHLRDTVGRLRGSGLSDTEVHAIAEFIRTMEPPKQRHDSSANHQTMVASGKALFDSETTGCATCHIESKGFTDGAKHDVGSVTVVRNGSPAEKQLDTPSLKFIGGTAPFFHDGRYKSMIEMLDSPEHAMGYSMNLTRDQRVALAAYLETL